MTTTESPTDYVNLDFTWAPRVPAPDCQIVAAVPVPSGDPDVHHHLAIYLRLSGYAVGVLVHRDGEETSRILDPNAYLTHDQAVFCFLIRLNELKGW